jgi:amidophosphoribosyltransferase
LVHENCGVVGIFSLADHNVVPFAIDMLRALQHRGQEAWGIAVPNKQPFKRMGLVSASASDFQSIVRKYRSSAVIGHVRYSTFGKRITSLGAVPEDAIITNSPSCLRAIAA